MSTTLRHCLHAAADALAQAVEDALANTGERLLTLPQAAERLGRHPATLRRRLRLGQLDLPVVLEDGAPRVRQSDIEAYIRGLGERRQVRAESVTPARRRHGALRSLIA